MKFAVALLALAVMGLTYELNVVRGEVARQQADFARDRREMAAGVIDMLSRWETVQTRLKIVNTTLSAHRIASTRLAQNQDTIDRNIRALATQADMNLQQAKERLEKMEKTLGPLCKIERVQNTSALRLWPCPTSPPARSSELTR